MDAMTKFALICVIYYLIYIGIRTCARRKFYKELSELIMRVDDQVHLQAGQAQQGSTYR